MTDNNRSLKLFEVDDGGCTMYFADYSEEDCKKSYMEYLTECFDDKEERQEIFEETTFVEISEEHGLAMTFFNEDSGETYSLWKEFESYSEPGMVAASEW